MNLTADYVASARVRQTAPRSGRYHVLLRSTGEYLGLVARGLDDWIIGSEPSHRSYATRNDAVATLVFDHEQEALRALDDFRNRMPLDPIVRGHLDSLQSTIKSSSQNPRPGAH